MSKVAFLQKNWAIAVEVVGASVCFLFIRLIWSTDTLCSFLALTVGEWLTVMSQVLFPAGIAVWLTVVNITGGAFGDYLRFSGNDKLLSTAFVFPVVLFAMTSVWLIVAKGAPSEISALIAYFLLAYSGIVFVTLITNLAAVIRLYGGFRVEIRKRGKGNLE